MKNDPKGGGGGPKIPLLEITTTHVTHTGIYMHDDDPCNEIATQHARALKYIIHCCCLRALRHGAVPPSHAYVLVLLCVCVNII